jgi:hypothetical protein
MCWRWLRGNLLGGGKGLAGLLFFENWESMVSSRSVRVDCCFRF